MKKRKLFRDCGLVLGLAVKVSQAAYWIVKLWDEVTNYRERPLPK